MTQPASPAVAVAAAAETRYRGRLAAGGATLAVLVGAGAARGAYFPESWGWIALACAWLAGLGLLLGTRAALGRAGAALVLSAGGLAGWIVLSGLWSADVTQTGLEAERMLAYVAALLALVVAGRRSFGAVAAGVWGAAALLAGWGLLTRLLPERLGVNDAASVYRLAQPIGYWNSLGLLAVVGALVGVGIAARARSLPLRALAGASLVPLSCALYFTYSRGSWIALAAGLLAAVALDRARLQLLATAAAAGAWAAAGIALASHRHALVTVGAQLADRSREGHRLLAVLAVLAVAAGASVLGVARLEDRVSLGSLGRRTLAGALLASLAAALALAFASYGAPWTIARHTWHSFATTSPGTQPNLNNRLLRLGGNGRVVVWRVAWREAQAHPWLGSGAGTYERHWNAGRPAPSKVRDAHNLYLETLAELGPPGLALLAVLLALPLALALRARRRALGSVVAGAYVAYLLHAVVDWDWEIGAVTLAALACGAALVTAGGPVEDAAARARRAWAGFAVVLAAASVYTIATRFELRQESSAADRGDWAAAAHLARRASSLQPWSTEPWQRLGEAELGAGRYAAARADLRRALAHDGGSWQLWLDLALASDGRGRAAAIHRVERLNPRSPELAAYLDTLQSLSRVGAP